MGKTNKVLLIGWDAADWKVIHDLMDQGQMPTLRRLVENGTMGNMATLFPPLSPMLWTSIATGKRPYKHGIYGFTEPTPDMLSVQPMTNVSRSSKAIWNILNQNHKKSLVVGWWPSHPAEPINGVMVSDFYHKTPKKPGDNWGLMKNCIHPEKLERILSQMRMHPDDLRPENILPFVPRAAEIDQDKDHRLSMLMRIICEAVTLHRAAETLLRTQDWDFAAIYYDAIDHFSHAFMRYHPPRQSFISEKEFRIYHNVVRQAYIMHDQMLAKLVDAISDDVTLILMSDHGFHPDHMRPSAIPTEPAGPAIEHRNIGIFVAAGKGIKKDNVVHGASLLDIAPTVLTIFGLPYGEDMDGRPLAEIFDEGEFEIRSIPSWEEMDGDDGQHQPGSVLDPADSKEALEQLIALGYIDRPDDDSTVAVANCKRELDYNLARAYMDGNLIGEAIPLLAKLYNQYPLEFRFGLQLANCLQSMNRFSELKLLVNDLNTRWRVAQVAAKKKVKEIAKITKQRYEQFRELKKIDEQNAKQNSEGGPKLAQYDLRGKPVLFSHSEIAAIRKIRVVARGNPQILDFLAAMIAASEGNFHEAVELMEEAETSTSKNPMYHNQLGNFYLELDRAGDAARSYGRTLEIDDLDPTALVGLCRCSLKTGKLQQAIDFGRQAIAIKFHFPIAHFFVGKALYRSQEFEAAILSFERALIQNPNFVEAHRLLSEIYSTHIVDEAAELKHSSAARELASERKEYLAAADSIHLKPVNETEFVSLLPKFDQENSTGFVVCLGQPKSALPKLAQPERKPIYVVTGLPRSGTSMLMQMLTAGGLVPVVDEIRRPDENNPKGYYESEQVKKLAYQNSWIGDCAGRVIKVVAPLVSYLPQHQEYRMIVINRDMDEIVRSQETMLRVLRRKGGELASERLKELFTNQISMLRLLLHTFEIKSCDVNHRTVITNPKIVANALAQFLELDLNIEKMAAAVEPNLYRHKSKY